MKKNKIIAFLIIVVLIILAQPGTLNYLHRVLKVNDWQTQVGIKEPKKTRADYVKPSKANLKDLKFDGNNYFQVINNNEPDWSKFPKLKKERLNLEKKDLLGRPKGAYGIIQPGDSLNFTTDNYNGSDDKIFKPHGWTDEGATRNINGNDQIVFSKTLLMPFENTYKNIDRNMFTGTVKLNEILKSYQSAILNYANEKHQVVRYQAELDTSLLNNLPKGIHVQAESADHKYKVNIYIYEAQPGLKINLQNGAVESR